MDYASSTRTAESRTRWKGIVVKSSVVPQQPCQVMGYTKLCFILLKIYLRLQNLLLYSYKR